MRRVVRPHAIFSRSSPWRQRWGLSVGRRGYRISGAYFAGKHDDHGHTAKHTGEKQGEALSSEHSSRLEHALESEAQVSPKATGLEKLEAMGFEKEYEAEPVLYGAFGTKETPVVVSSWFDSRIVGCLGGPGEKAHELLWHEVRRDKPLVCLECGQFFVLKPHPLKATEEKAFEGEHAKHGHH